ncbi:MAG: beta-lactamase family protein [Micrococcales bacterium]|nr:beta-lactamase family protein [Micrococcales bacterium]
MSSETDLVAIEAELDAHCAAYVAAGFAPGLVYGVVGPDGLRHCLGVGHADDEHRRPDEHTRFPVASLSKAFTTAAVLICRDRGLLGLDDPVTTWVPQLRLVGGDRPPTVRELASMCGGLTEDNSWTDVQIDMPAPALAAQLTAGVRLSGLPGVGFDYSNLGYALLGLVVEQASGTAFATFVTTEILEPLGLADTSFSPLSHGRQVLATGYTRCDDRWVGLPDVTAQGFAAAAGMVSTIADLARWITWLCDGFDEDGPATGPLSRSSRREMQRVHTVIAPTVTAAPEGTWAVSVTGYGLGLIVEHDLRHGVIVTHPGSLPGYRTHIRWHPASRLGLVVASNSHRGGVGTLGARSFSRLLTAVDAPARTVRLWPETVAARRDTETLVRTWDDALASRLFAANIEPDRPVAQRRAEIDRLVAAVGPLRDPLPDDDVIAATSPAEVTWSIPGEHGELVCMVHLTSTEPVGVQELVVTARTGPRARSHLDISPRRTSTPLPAWANVGVEL